MMGPVADSSLDHALQVFETYLRTERLKMTGQRRNMVKAALSHPGHFTAEDLYQRLFDGGDPVSMATVYRGLRLLEEAGIVGGHDFADGQRRYEQALKREHHDHLVCVDCRAVFEFQNREIERQQRAVAVGHGFEIEAHDLTLYGRCKAWRETSYCVHREERERKMRSR
ncbi:MAG: Fur family transcriptional regulator [Planctomycetota bacterium]